MIINPAFPDRTPANASAAVALQKELRDRVSLIDTGAPVRFVAGIDVGYDVRENISKAALVLIDSEDLTLVETVIATAATPFPYIPGLLSFREAPVIIEALRALKHAPDLLMIDGQGIAHPRRLGIAAHIGVMTGLPALGVAKSVLCGHYAEPASSKGSRTPLIHKDEIIGTAYRSRTDVKPIFISPGHRISHDSAVAIIEKCLTRFRLPEPTRLADKLSKFGKNPVT